ncbi:MAG: LON peptidase substrate-binding domain-containing protein [Bacteroidia bacterium]|nr:LON peptidase substrate-binding domain-containing protein [Bacteroidia bacterium]
MTRLFPMFPLNLVVFPGERLRLHIFEPRYRQLIGECLVEHKTFGIPTIIDKKLMGLGTEVKILSLDKKYGGGEMDISTEGIRRLEVKNFFEKSPEKLYPVAEVVWPESEDTSDETLRQEVKKLLAKLHYALGISKKFSENQLLSYEMAHHVGFSIRQEYELLTIDTETDRLKFYKKHLETILPVVMETERLKAKAKLNGHYKNVIPPK